MAYDEHFADRVRSAMKRRGVSFVEKQMMGGLCLMVDGKMCLGIAGSRLMVRLDPAIYEQALQLPGCTPMDFTGKPLKGFVFVQPEGHDTQHELEYWVELAVEFNPRAKPSKSRKTTKQPASNRAKPKRPAKSKRKFE
jgi:TfoX/Sxy family transcriptional regulator of competence genes